MVDSETSTSLPGLSRRHVLSTLMATAGSTALGRAAAGASKPELLPDPAVAAWKAWRPASSKALALCRKQQRLETTLVQTIGFPAVTLDVPALDEPVRIMSLEEFDDLVSSVPEVGPLRDHVAAELDAHQARWDEADRRLGYSVALEQEEAALAREQPLVEALLAAEALTIPGIVGKIEALIALDAPSDDDDERPWAQLRRIRVELITIMHRYDVLAA